MIQYTLRRLFVVSIPVVIGITMLAFGLMRLTPSDPLTMMLTPEQLGNQEFVERRRAQLGLDQSLPVQYLAWIRQVAVGNMGFSYITGRPVSAMLADRFWPTVSLMLAAITIAVIIGLVLGMLSAVKQNSWIDYLSGVFAVSAISIPNFFLGLAAIYYFSLVLGVLPPAGMGPRGGVDSIFEYVPYIIMPATILGLTVAGPYTRYVRAGILEVLGEDYLRTANAKGVSTFRILFRHALRNALVPLITVVTLTIPALFGGAVVVEAIFSWPGMGSLILTAVSGRDYPVIVGFTLVIGILVVITNLIADLLYALADPRVRLS